MVVRELTNMDDLVHFRKRAGSCYELAWDGFVWKKWKTLKDMTLVHGYYMNSDWGHAWLESDKCVFDLKFIPIMRIGKVIAYDRLVVPVRKYFAVEQAQKAQLEMRLRTGQFTLGPWYHDCRVPFGSGVQGAFVKGIDANGQPFEYL